jgi:hypothetical protein
MKQTNTLTQTTDTITHQTEPTPPPSSSVQNQTRQRIFTNKKRKRRSNNLKQNHKVSPAILREVEEILSNTTDVTEILSQLKRGLIPANEPTVYRKPPTSSQATPLLKALQHVQNADYSKAAKVLNEQKRTVLDQHTRTKLNELFPREDFNENRFPGALVPDEVTDDRFIGNNPAGTTDCVRTISTHQNRAGDVDQQIV